MISLALIPSIRRTVYLIIRQLRALTKIFPKSGKILLAGDVYNRLDCLQKVLLPLLALSLCCLGAMFWTIPLRATITSELLTAEGAFSCLSHLTPFYVVLQSFHANRHGVNFRQSLTILVNSFHDVTFFKWGHFLVLFPLVLQSTVVHSCQPLSTLSTRWQNKSPQNSPR